MLFLFSDQFKPFLIPAILSSSISPHLYFGFLYYTVWGAVVGAAPWGADGDLCAGNVLGTTLGIPPFKKVALVPQRVLELGWLEGGGRISGSVGSLEPRAVTGEELCCELSPACAHGSWRSQRCSPGAEIWAESWHPCNSLSVWSPHPDLFRF